MSNSKILNLTNKNASFRISTILKKIGWRLIFACIFLGLLYYQVQHVFASNSANAFMQTVENLSFFSLLFFLVTIVLSPVNWSLETLKWSYLMQDKGSFYQHFKAVLAGVTFSMFKIERESYSTLLIQHDKHIAHTLSLKFMLIKVT